MWTVLTPRGTTTRKWRQLTSPSAWPRMAHFWSPNQNRASGACLILCFSVHLHAKTDFTERSVCMCVCVCVCVCVRVCACVLWWENTHDSVNVSGGAILSSLSLVLLGCYLCWWHSYIQPHANATTTTTPKHCTLNISSDDISKLVNDTDTPVCTMVLYHHVTCTASNSVLVSDHTDRCRPCTLKWTGCEDWRRILLDYVSLGPYVLVTINVRDVSVAFSVKLQTLITWYPFDVYIRHIPISPTFGAWFVCFYVGRTIRVIFWTINILVYYYYYYYDDDDDDYYYWWWWWWW